MRSAATTQFNEVCKVVGDKQKDSFNEAHETDRIILADTKLAIRKVACLLADVFDNFPPLCQTY